MVRIIAIDGPAASGKGTLARHLAGKLGFSHLDTGALYRAVGLEALQAGEDPAIEAQAVAACQRLSEKLCLSLKLLESNELRGDFVASAASKVAAFPSVRNMLVQVQRDFAHHPPEAAKGAVLDGRDIGTVICPDAGLKLYVTADIEIRAQRRLKELHSKGISATYEPVLEDMRARDARDSGREAAPLRPAQDAIILDSSNLDAGQLLEIALEHAIKAFGLHSIKPA